MTYRDAKRGAAVAGAILFFMPLLDVFVGVGTPGAVHVIVGTLGAMLVVLSGQPVKGEGLLDILFNPRAQFGVFLLPAQQPGAQISASLGGVAAVVKPSQLNEAIVAALVMVVPSIVLSMPCSCATVVVCPLGRMRLVSLAALAALGRLGLALPPSLPLPHHPLEVV